MAVKRNRASSRTATPSTGIVRVGDVLPQLIAKYGLQQRRNLERIEEVWRAAVGEPYASVTRIIGLRRGTLEVAVPHSAFVQELSFRRQELLAAMQKTLADEKIKKIKFTV